MATTEKSPESPTTVRIPDSSVKRLDHIRDVTRLTRNALITLAIDSFVDFVDRTGKLPVPALQRRTKSKESPRG